MTALLALGLMVVLGAGMPTLRGQEPERADEAKDESRQVADWATLAKVTKEQTAAAAKLRIPVTKELDLGGSVKILMVLIPAGKFGMGSNTGGLDEKPVHDVEITKPFYMAVTEVTQAQWWAVMGTEPWKDRPCAGWTPDSAANYLSWNDATEYLGNLSAKTGGTYRLPTEAEWEYACRAGSTGKYCFGDHERRLGEYAWYYGNAYGAGKRRPQPVALRKPNAWGLHDMHGNVWEWCQDWYDAGYYRKSPQQDPKGPTTADQTRVLRGGSWYTTPAFCCSAYRNGSVPAYTSHYDGFRVVLEVQ